MIKNRLIVTAFSGLVVLSGLTSCEDFLGTVPDNRTEITSVVAAQELLTAAYPQTNATEIGEMMSDNVADNGPRYTTDRRLPEECYKWQDPTEIAQDSPYSLWTDSYSSIAACNNALEFLRKEDSTEEINAIRAEALVCRAYNHFVLATTFCQYYNPITSSTDLGIPYMDRADVSITEVPDRKTVKETYDKINADLEEGLPFINDGIYASGVIKYHFNKAAAYAFGARFNLYYGNYQKAAEYATIALGKNPASVLRNYDDYKILSGYEDFGKYYVRTQEDCNLLLHAPQSTWNYDHWPYSNWFRYAHNRSISSNQTYDAPGPWGGKNKLYLSQFLYTAGGDASIFFPKLFNFFEVTDIVSQTGYPHTVNTLFTTDETLLTRAEAYALQGKYGQALDDLKIWYKARTVDAPDLTDASIKAFYGGKSGSSYVAPAFTTDMQGVDTDNTEMMQYLRCVLHFRRLETIHEGLRWFDIKRYGIEIVHPLEGEADMILKVGDPRRVLQLPADVISAGMVPNPR